MLIGILLLINQPEPCFHQWRHCLVFSRKHRGFFGRIAGASGSGNVPVVWCASFLQNCI